jgi:hypothetical protein
VNDSVTLTWAEVRVAAMMGVERNIWCMYHGAKPRFIYEGREALWSEHIIGAMAEIAVSKLTDRCPAMNGRPGYDGDVSGLEVRATPRLDGALIVHDSDRDEAPFILVRFRVPRFHVPGWIMGADAKRAEWWRTDVPHPAYFVPASALRPVEELTR